MTGLTSAEVQEKLNNGLNNVAVDSSTRTVKEIVKENVFTYFNLIFTVLAVLLILVGSFRDLSFMLIIFANTGIGIYQEIRSKNTLDKLKLGSMPKVTVIRDGRPTEVASEQLVLGDLIQLHAGSTIPADAVVASGQVTVNEALITGEADEITKTKGDSLLSGSFLVTGECLAELTAVGREAYISKLVTEATRQEKNDSRSQMVKSLDRLVMFIGILIIPIGAVLFYQQYAVADGGFRESVIAMVAAVLGMVPEGLFMMTSIALAVSAVRLAQKNVLVQNMRCIETLARIDVLCVDKTGTITENDMHVAGMDALDDTIEEEDIRIFIGDLAAGMGDGNITMTAMQEYFAETSDRKPEDVCPFSSAYKYSAAIYEDGTFVLGAPEYVLGGLISRYEERIHELSQQGYRVLAFGYTREELRGEPIRRQVRPLALVYLRNPIRETAPATFQYFAKNGVQVKVISGDDPITVSNVALEAGIENAGSYIDARSLETQRDVDAAVKQYTVFGRVTPDQKRMIVRGLKKLGLTVGMTGDGVNDILAFRDADTSVAMASGSDAAKNAAQLVLLDSDFAKMPSVVAEGRRVVNNITKTATLYLTKNIFSFLLAIFSMISVLQYPLQPSQITVISMFTIGIPSFLLSLEPNREKIRGNFLANVFKMSLPAGITVFLSVSGLLIFGQVLDIEQASISTASSALVALVEFLILARVARPMNQIHVGMMVVMVSGFFYMILVHNELFGISPMNATCWLLLAVFLLATEALFRYFYMLTALLGLLLTKDGRVRFREILRKRKEEAGADFQVIKEEVKERENVSSGPDTEKTGKN